MSTNTREKMKTQNDSLKTEVSVEIETSQSSSLGQDLEASGLILQTSETSYHELADYPIVEKDLIQSLQDNLKLLSELQERQSFLMSEIRYLMRM